MISPTLPEVNEFRLRMDWKRSVVRVSIYLGIPVLSGMAIHNLRLGRLFVGMLDSTMLLIVILFALAIRGRMSEEVEYRVFSILARLFGAVAGIALLYEVGFQSNLSRMPWCYIYPLLVFFVAGGKEGIVWVSIFYGILVFVVFRLDLQGITLSQWQGLRFRFLISFPIVCMLAIFLEHGFRRAQQRLLYHQRIFREYENRFQRAYEELNTEIRERKQAEEALRAEKQRFQTASESSPFGIVLSDQDGTHKYINPKFRELFGYDLNDVPDGQTWFRKAYPDPAYRHHIISTWINDNVLGSPKPGEKISRTFTVTCKDGTEKIINFFPVKLETGEFLTSSVDFTERKRAEEELREKEERLQALMDSSPIGISWSDTEGNIEYINRKFHELFGYTIDDIPTVDEWRRLAYPDPAYRKTVPSLVAMLAEAKKGKDEATPVEVTPIEVTPTCKDGSTRWVEYTGAFASNRILAIYKDITERKQGEEKLRSLSLHDPLTGLYNRVYFEEEMSRIEKGRCDAVGIVSCDVDGLKLVNDTLGHDQGDHVLVLAARVIRESFRKGDLVARMGGDEFSVLLSDVTEPIIENACQRIREAVAGYNATNPELPLSISVGYAISNRFHRRNLKDLFKEADNNMYRRKLYQTKSIRSTIVKTLINTLQARDFTTEKHVIRLEKLITGMATLIGLPESMISDLSLLAKFHDIGKVGVPDSILFKRGPLTAEEWTEMKRHCEIGYRIALSSSELVPIADWILKHHEWWNGQGYPLGIREEEIPIECRVLAIADAYEALTSVRPYRRAFSHEEALAELLSHSGTQFEPKLLEKFVQMLETHAPELEVT